MSALPSSGEISLGDIKANRAGSTGTDPISLQTESEAFASGSIVDGSGAQTTARLNLDNAPYAISEFRNANFSSDEFSNIVITTAGGTSDFQTVDTENLTIAFNTTQTGVHSVQLVGSNNVVDDTETNSPSSGVVTVTFNNLNLTDDTYTPRLRLGFLTQDGTNITHHDAIAVGAITTPSLQTVANNSATTVIEHQISITNDNAFNNIDWTFTKSSGDGSAPSNLTNSSDRSPSVTYTGAGVFTISCTVDGDPLGRNSANASNNGVSHTIAFSKAITINNPSSLNEGGTITALGQHQGFSSGIDVDLIRSDNNSTLLENDDDTNSLVNITNYNKTFTAPAQTDSTLSVKVRAFDGSDQAISNAFNIYPNISDQFDTNDLSFGASAVEVNQNVTLDVANDVTDNIVGYAWSNQGSGNMSVQSGNASAGDTDGSADDSVSIIDLTDQSHPTVRFDTVEQNKTIRLSLFGRTNQTATADKTIDVELADAISINGVSDTNGTNAITLTGNHSGFVNGVTVGLVTAASNTSFISGKSAEETTNPDSRFVQRSFSESFTPVDQTTTQTLQGRVVADGESDSANTSTFNYFPELRSNRNTINPDITTIFSSTNNTKQDTTSPLSCSFNTPGNATDNVTSRQYSTNGLSGHTFANNNATTHSAATTTFGGGTQVGSTLVKLDIAGNSNQTSRSTQNITVNFSEEVTPTGLQESSDKGFNQQLGVQYTVQGFTATRIDGELYDTADLSTKIGSTAIFENGVSLGAAQTLTSTITTNINPQTTFSVGSPATADGEDGFKIKLIGKDSGGTIQATAFTNAFTLNVQATDTINTQTLGGAEIGYPTLLDAADTTPEGVNSTETVHLIGTIVDSKTLFTSATLATAFDGDPLNDNTRQHYSNASNVFVVNDSGAVSSLRSRTPNQPTIASSSFTEDSILIRVTANTEVTRTFTTSITPSGGSPSTSNVTVSSQASSHTQDITFNSLDGNKSHAIFVTPKNNDKTGTQSSTVNITTAALIRTLSTSDSSTADSTMLFTGTSFSSDHAARHKYSDQFRVTVGNAVANDKLTLTISATGTNLTDFNLKFAANKNTSTSPYDVSNGNLQGTGVVESNEVTTGASQDIQFTGLSSGDNAFSVRIEAAYDGITNNVFASQEMDLTISAVVRDSSNTIVVSSTTVHTAKATHEPGI